MARELSRLDLPVGRAVAVLRGKLLYRKTLDGLFWTEEFSGR
jgi:hypothetical protein